MRILIKDVIANGDKKPVLVTRETKLYKDLEKLESPQDVVRIMTDVFDIDKAVAEQVYIIALDSKKKPLAFFFVNQGTIDNSLVDIRGIFMRLLLTNAAKFILIHNHPSGDPFPSAPDYSVTRKLKELSPIMGIEFSDHIIIASEDGIVKHHSFFQHLWKKKTDGSEIE